MRGLQQLCRLFPNPMNNFDFQQGCLPLLVSMPHSGLALPKDLEQKLSNEAKLLPDTDWHIPQLYNFVSDMGASVIKANFSRFVIDQNRPPDNVRLYPGLAGTDLCPLQLFSGKSLYLAGEQPTQQEVCQRLTTYWQPYHHKLGCELERIRKLHGYAILYDAHSIRSVVPRLFEGQLPDLNVGTVHTKSCSPTILEAVVQQLKTQNSYTYVVDDRFVGGYITRHYGQPKKDIHAVQMELSQINYMDEDTFTYIPERANELKKVLRTIVSALLSSANRIYS